MNNTMKTPQLYQYPISKGWNMIAIAHAESEQQALELCAEIGLFNCVFEQQEGIALMPSAAKKPCAKRWDYNG